MYRSKLLWEWGNLVEECQPPKYPHSTGIQKKINPRVSFEKHSGSKLRTGWRTDAWTCPQPAFLLVSQYYEDHHRCQHSRWTDALTVDSGHVQSQPCLSGGSTPQGASQICTAHPPCRYYHPTCAVCFKIHFLENLKGFILRRSRNTRMGEGAGLLH